MLNTNQIDTLGQKAAEAAMRGAATYIRTNKLENLDLERITQLIRIRAKAALPEALRDAKDALDINQGQMAQATFMASMTLAGINAVKDYQGEK
jgi:hypothetical protein